jgi:HK97 family phage major capsid protein
MSATTLEQECERLSREAIARLKDQKRSVTAEAEALLPKLGEKMSDEAKRKFDELHTVIARINTKIETHERSLYPASSFPVAGVQNAAETWRDLKTGEEIRTFSSRDSVESHFRKSEEPSPLRFGAYLRALLLGPKNEEEKRALSEGTNSAGGFTVPAVTAAQFIDKLRARSFVVKAGAQTIPLSTLTTTIARVATDPTISWVGENGTVTASDPVFDSVSFTAKKLIGLIQVSRELVQDSVNIESALEAMFAGTFAAELDRVCLIGAGTSTEPKGIKNTSGVGSVSMGTNGAALTNYDPVIDAIKAMHDANAGDPTAAIMAPRSEANFSKLKDTTSQPLQRPPQIANLPFYATSKLPTNETQGTSNLASSIYVGDYSQLLIGMRMELTVEVLRERYADSYQFGFLGALRADVALQHAEAFTRIVGVL